MRVSSVVVVVMVLAGGCSRSEVPPEPAPVGGSGSAPAGSGEASTPSAAVDPVESPSAPASSTAEPLPAVFRGTVRPLPAALATRMDGTSWHQGCPVPLEDLRLLTLRYWGLDGEVHRGPMVTNEAVADDLVEVRGYLGERHAERQVVDAGEHHERVGETVGTVAIAAGNVVRPDFTHIS